MALLDRKNSNATIASAAKHAATCAIVGAIVFFTFFKPTYTEAWSITLPIWLLLCAGVGALWEWQVSERMD